MLGHSAEAVDFFLPSVLSARNSSITRLILSDGDDSKKNIGNCASSCSHAKLSVTREYFAVSTPIVP